MMLALLDNLVSEIASQPLEVHVTTNGLLFGNKKHVREHAAEVVSRVRKVQLETK